MTVILTEAANALKRAGAEALVICTNTMHKIAPAISANTGLPILHIADATAQQLKRDGVDQVALLGTQFIPFCN